MMQSVNLRDTDHFSVRWYVHFSWHGRIPFQRLMWSDFMIVAKVFSQYSPQVFFTQYDHKIQTLSPNTSDQPFGIWILPRRPRCRDNLFNSHSRNPTAKMLSIDLITISDQKPWCVVFWEGFDQLLSRPDCCRV